MAIASVATVMVFWTDALLPLTLLRARAAANDPRLLPVRVTAERRRFSQLLGDALLTKLRSERFEVAADLEDLAKRVDGDTAARANGMAGLLGERCDLAAESFGRIRVRDGADWNDLAAAHSCAAFQNGHPDHWLAALAAADEALTFEGTLTEARFNRAKIIDSLGITPIARARWEKYLREDRSSPWARVGRERIASFTPSDSDGWKTATADIEKVSADELSRLTDRYPQAARRFGDGAYLSFWATEMDRGNPTAGRNHLERVRIIAKTLERRGEPLLTDAVSAIDRAKTNPRKHRTLINAQLAYFKGRLALRNGDPSKAEPELRIAARRFEEGGSPMAGVAEFWLAGALTDQNRPSDALLLLESLLARETAAGGRYRSLIGHAQYQLSLLVALRGNWSAALEAAQSSKAAFTALGERGNVANANAMLSESYDFLGQPDLARKHAVDSLRDSAADGALDRTRVTLATLCRIEMRAGHWDHARALARLEGELAPFARDIRLEPDMFIRRGVAEWHLESAGAANHWLGLARTAVTRIADPALRRKLLADVAGVEGTFVRRRNPRRGIALLSAAIAFQKEAIRPIFLPELHLERGRAHRAMKDFRAAEADFEAGLAELEHQRSRVNDAELRPGIFDDALELFDEVIALQLRRRDVESVWRSVERGRARAVLEQISSRNDTFEPLKPPRIADVQRELDAASVLLEYVSLPDRLIVICVTHDRSVTRTIPIAREALIRVADAFTENPGARGHSLHDILIAPLRSELRGVSAINIVAPDILQRVPFAALFDRTTNTWLVQRYTIATSPSAGVFLSTLERARSLPRGEPPQALVFANPAIPREQFPDLAWLSYAENEAARIARHYTRVDVFSGDAATAERFFALAPTREFVHFAGHGVINDREPSTSALVCASSPRIPGAVTARDIARMKFRSTRAVVLAACSTMTGRNAAIEGVPSLARAFVVAGVPAVVGTLWDIEDGEAATITQPLHEQLSRGVAPANALRLAQVAAIRRRLPPSQWAAFALMGSAGAPSH